MVIDSNLAVDTITPATVKYVVQKIVRTAHPSKVIVFGSQARGDRHRDSDLDVLVITAPGADRERVRLAIERSLRGRRFDIDLLVRTPAEVAWNTRVENPFYIQDILRDGRVMYER